MAKDALFAVWGAEKVGAGWGSGNGGHKIDPGLGRPAVARDAEKGGETRLHPRAVKAAISNPGTTPRIGPLHSVASLWYQMTAPSGATRLCEGAHASRLGDRLTVGQRTLTPPVCSNPSPPAS